MRLVTRIGFSALAVLATNTLLAKEPAAPRHVADVAVAVIDGDAAPRTPNPEPTEAERYVGRYDDVTGHAFFVDREGALLTIEVPPELGGGASRLHRQEAADTFATAEGARVIFRTDDAGRITGLEFHPSGALEAVAAGKAPEPRGIVTVYELLPPSGELVVAESQSQ